jgi:hypothetical protein
MNESQKGGNFVIFAKAETSTMYQPAFELLVNKQHVGFEQACRVIQEGIHQREHVFMHATVGSHVLLHPARLLCSDMQSGQASDRRPRKLARHLVHAAYLQFHHQRSVFIWWL